MKSLYLAVALLGLTSHTLHAADNTEPPLGYTLTIDKEKVRLASGETKQLKGTYTDPKITLVPDDFRLFTYGGVTFKYPANFAFETHSEAPGVKIWNLVGSLTTITLYVFESEKVTPEQVVAEMKKRHGPDAKIEKITRIFNGKTLSGMRLTTTLAGTKNIEDVLAIPTEKGSRLLKLLDDPPEDEILFEEPKKVVKFLNETLKY